MNERPGGLGVGDRLRSQVCDTEVIVVRAPRRDVDLRCGGQPMVAIHDKPADGLVLDDALSGGSQLGKRYTTPSEDEFELLVTKPGKGTLASGATPLLAKETKPLPSSD